MAEGQNIHIAQFSKGLCLDFHPSNVPEGYVTDALNIVLSTDTSNSFTANNELGNKEVVEASTMQNLHVIGYLVYATNIILFSINKETGASEIGIVKDLFKQPGIDTKSSYIPLITTNNNTATVYISEGVYTTYNTSKYNVLNFSYDHPVRVVWKKIYNNNSIFYFTDNSNVPRFINIDDLPLPTASNPIPDLDRSISLFASNVLPKIILADIQDTGTLKIGTYQFLVRYLDVDGNPTLFSNATPPIYITQSRNTRNTIEGGVSGTLTNKSIKLSVSNIDTNYKFIELIRVGVEGATNTVTARRVTVKEITGNTIDIIYSSMDDNDPIVSLSELVIESLNYTTAKEIHSKDNILLLANLKTDDVISLQSYVNRLKVKYNVKEIPYKNPYPTIEQSTADITPPTFTGYSYVIDTEKNVIYFQIKDIDNSTTPLLTSIICKTLNINTSATNDVTIGNSTFPNPTSISLYQTYIKAVFDSSVDFTTFNFDNFDTAYSSTVTDVIYYFEFVNCYGITHTPSFINNLANLPIITPTTGNLASVVAVSPPTTLNIGSDYIIFSDTNGLTPIHCTIVSINPSAFLDIIVEASAPILADGVAASTAKVADYFDVLDNISELPELTNVTNNTLFNNTYLDDYASSELATDFKTYKRGEVYSIGIRLLSSNGGKTEILHIPGNNRTAIYDSINLENNRLSAIPDQTYTNRKNNSRGYMGTYISNEEYSSDKGYPNNISTGQLYSKDSKIRHHIMPSYDDEPILRYDSVTNETYLRILGAFMVYVKPDGTEGNFSEWFNSGLLSGYVGYEIYIQPRDLPENRYVEAQALLLPTTRTRKGYWGNNASQEIKPSTLGGFGAVISNGGGVYVVGFKDGASKYLGYRHNADAGSQHCSMLFTELVCPDGMFNPDLSINEFLQVKLVGQQKTLLTVHNFSGGTGSPGDIKSGKVGHGNCVVQTTSQYCIPLDSVYSLNSKGDGSSGTTVDFSGTYIEPIIEVKAANKQFLTGEVNIGANYDAYSGYEAKVTNPIVKTIRPIPVPKNYLTEVVIQYSRNNSAGNSMMGENSYVILYDNFYNTVKSNNAGDYAWEWGNNYISTKRLIFDLIRPNQSQYGSIEGAKFRLVKTYTSVSSILDDQIFYNGDIFLSCTSVNSIMSTRRKETERNKDLKANAPVVGDFHAANHYVLMETTINGNWLHETIDPTNNNVQKGLFPKRPLVNSGIQSTGYPYYSCWYNSASGTYNINGILFDYALANNNIAYNTQYLLQDGFNVSVTKPLIFTKVNDYGNRIIYSKPSIEGELTDGYKQFLPNNFHDVPKDKGVIEILFTVAGRLWVQTKYTTYACFFNDNVTQATSEGEIYLGTGGVFSRPSVEVYALNGGYCGSNAKWGGVDTPFGRYFIDSHQGKVFFHNGSNIVEIESLCSKYTGVLYTDAEFEEDNPFIGKGLVAAYDYDFNRAIFTKLKNPSGVSTIGTTISYYPEIKNYYSFHSYKPTMMFAIGNNFYSHDNYANGWTPNTIRQYNNYQALAATDPDNIPYFCNFGGEQFPSYIEYSANTAPIINKVYDSVQVNGEHYSPISKEFRKDLLINGIHCKTMFGDSGKINLLNSYLPGNNAGNPLNWTADERYYPLPSSKDVQRSRFVSNAQNVSIPRNNSLGSYNVKDNNVDYSTQFKSRLTGKYCLVKVWLAIDTANPFVNQQKISIFNVLTKFRPIAR